MRQPKSRIALVALLTVPAVALATYGIVWFLENMNEQPSQEASTQTDEAEDRAATETETEEERQERALAHSPVPQFPEEPEAPLLDEPAPGPPSPPPSFEELLADRALWPDTVTLAQDTELPVLTDNVQVGEVGVKAGSPLEVQALLPGENIRVRAYGKTFLVRAADTDLRFTPNPDAAARIENDPEIIRQRKLAEARKVLQAGIDEAFLKWARRNTEVTEISLEKGEILARLPEQMYADAERGRAIAELLARSYIRHNQEGGGQNNYTYAKILLPESGDVWVAASYYGN